MQGLHLEGNSGARYKKLEVKNSLQRGIMLFYNMCIQQSIALTFLRGSIFLHSRLYSSLAEANFHGERGSLYWSQQELGLIGGSRSFSQGGYFDVERRRLWWPKRTHRDVSKCLLIERLIFAQITSTCYFVKQHISSRTFLLFFFLVDQQLAERQSEFIWHCLKNNREFVLNSRIRMRVNVNENSSSSEFISCN